jgi:hypothetical protein
MLTVMRRNNTETGSQAISPRRKYHTRKIKTKALSSKLGRIPVNHVDVP